MFRKVFIFVFSRITRECSNIGRQGKACIHVWVEAKVRSQFPMSCTFSYASGDHLLLHVMGVCIHARGKIDFS